jgi:hypothetical protein
MGYSFHTPCSSKKARDEMFAFLQENYRPFSVLAAGSGCLSEIAFESELENREWKHTDSIRGPLMEDMSYGEPKGPYIGFDFGSSMGGEGAWMKDFCRWVAMKVGRRRTFPDIEGKVPYVVYDIPENANDRDSIWPVLERSEFDVTADLKDFVVDDGFRGWAQQVRKTRKHSEKGALRRQKEEGWSAKQLGFYRERQEAMWDKQERVAKRADTYIKRELRRLSELWEKR